MVNLYNRIQGRSLGRLAALSDGIFAVAMTLLVLDLHIPSAAQAQTNCALAPLRGGNFFFKCGSLPVWRPGAELRTAEGWE
jgi:hypothetical protein